MKPSHGILLVVAILGVAAFTVHNLHDEGLLGAIAELTGGGAAAAPAQPPVKPAPEPPPPEPPKVEPAPEPPPVVRPKRSNMQQMAIADRAWLRGDLDLATSLFMAARAVSGDMDEREKAQKALDRAILGWAVSERPAAGVPTGPKAESQLVSMLGAIEARPTEQGWFDALRFASAARLSDRLPYLATNAVDAAARGGPVERQVAAFLPSAGPSRRKDLTLALARYGLGAPALEEKPVASGPKPPVPTGSPGRPAQPPVAVAPVGGTGKFSEETLVQMRNAVALEAEGRKYYALASPDNPDQADRMANVRKAYKTLRQVRAIYSTALDEDPSAPGLENRLREISRLVSDMKKTLPPGGE